MKILRLEIWGRAFASSDIASTEIGILKSSIICEISENSHFWRAKDNLMGLIEYGRDLKNNGKDRSILSLIDILIINRGV